MTKVLFPEAMEPSFYLKLMELTLRSQFWEQISDTFYCTWILS